MSTPTLSATPKKKNSFSSLTPTKANFSGTFTSGGSSCSASGAEGFPTKEQLGDPAYIQEQVEGLSDLILRTEDHLAVHHELVESDQGHVRKQVAAREFMSLAGQIHRCIARMRESKQCMRDMFHKTDRAGRLLYIFDAAHAVGTKFQEEGDHHLFLEMPNFAREIYNAVEQQKLVCISWQELVEKEKLKVGFGPHADMDWRKDVQRKFGVIVEESPPPEVPELENAGSEEQPDLEVPLTEEKKKIVELDEDIENATTATEPAVDNETRDKAVDTSTRRETGKERGVEGENAGPRRQTSSYGPAGWATNPKARMADTEALRLDPTLLQRRTIITQQNTASTNNRSSRQEEQALTDVVAISDGPIHKFEQGYYVEIECVDVDDGDSEVMSEQESDVGCMGLGVTFLNPDTLLDQIQQVVPPSVNSNNVNTNITDVSVNSQVSRNSTSSSVSMPRRLDRIKQGWFFTGPYKGGSTRRVYRDGKKDIRFILDGEEERLLRWSVGDKMGLLVRPKYYAGNGGSFGGEDQHAGKRTSEDESGAGALISSSKRQWTISLYINRNIVLACTIDVDEAMLCHESGESKLRLYACAEAYGYVKAIRLNRHAHPRGLAIAGMPRKKEEESGVKEPCDTVAAS